MMLWGVNGKDASLASKTMMDGGYGAAPQGHDAYSDVFAKLCTKDSYWASQREMFLPNFACENDHVKNHGVPFITSHIYFGLPYKSAQMQSEIDYDTEIEGLEEDYGMD